MNAFRTAARQALANPDLQSALHNARSGFVDKRRIALKQFPAFSAVQDYAIAVKNHTLSHLDSYLVQFEENVIAHGGQVHWAADVESANQIIVDICKKAGAKRVAKGKSMVSEEMRLNHALADAGLVVRETDLGEYIIQLAEELPSHIVAPAMHKTKSQVEDLFSHHHKHPPNYDRSRESIVAEARSRLREDFLTADVGITGANFLIADSGSTVIVTNEGNGDLSACLPKVHIVTAGIEKLIPRLTDLPSFLRLLARSATGQAMTAYTSIFSGPKREDDLDGPEAFHVVLLDNGRSKMLGSRFQDAMRCIRCGACMNHCAVYQKIGGHAYDAVYPGPIGQVITPLLDSEKHSSSKSAIDACTMNGHCVAVCPMKIPLSSLIREHRINYWNKRDTSMLERVSLWVFRTAAKHPNRYVFVVSLSKRLWSVCVLLRLNKIFALITKPIFSRWTRFRVLPRFATLASKTMDNNT